MKALKSISLTLVIFISAFSINAQKIVQEKLTINARSLDLYSPKRIGNRKAPLLIALHGGLTNSQYMAERLKIEPTLEKLGMRAAFLNGTNQRKNSINKKTWNAGKCCGSAHKQKIDDVAYIKSVIESLANKNIADLNHIYLIGSSNGAMMSYRFACENNNLVRAVIAISGTYVAESCPSLNGVDIIQIHSAKDTSVPLAGGGIGRLVMNGPFPPFLKVRRTLQDSGAQSIKQTILKTGEHGLEFIYEAAQHEYNMDIGELIIHTINK